MAGALNQSLGAVDATPVEDRARSGRILDHGVYIVAEARRYAGVSDSTARSWLRGRSGRKASAPLLHSDYEPCGKDFAISFLDLIDLFVAGRFRKAGVSMSVVRAAYESLGRELGTEHPFAHGELYLHGKRIIRAAASAVSHEVLCEVTSGQLFFRDLKAGLEKIDYGPVHRLAARWRIAEGVLIDPRVAMGKPTVQGTGTATAVIASQYGANGRDGALVADLFGMSEQDVANAVEFERAFGKAA
ncbi:MAG: hypothetical protein GC160_03775 [Acidobacteria bacterium]|nr:hypothetical protein [Acidobacteriota bacterium]